MKKKLERKGPWKNKDRGYWERRHRRAEFAKAKTQKIPKACIACGPGSLRAFPLLTGWDYLAVGKICGWICPMCRVRLNVGTSGPGLPTPPYSPRAPKRLRKLRGRA